MVYITDEIKQLDQEVFKLASAYKPKINPLNSDVAFNGVLECKPFKFEYDSSVENHQKVMEQISSVSVPSGIFSSLYRDKLREIKLKLNMVDSIGSDDFSRRSRQLYGFPKKKLINKAYTLLELEPSQREPVIELDRAREILQNQLTALKIDWKISSKKMLTSACVRPEKKEVIISDNYRYSEKYIKRLAIHEVGTHGVRAMNGRLQPLKIFRNFPGYVATEEGLAVFNEEITGLLDNDSVRRYAGRVVAIAYADSHTLDETYSYLCKYFDKETACLLALRVKRGLADSTSVGAFTKDYVYLKGLFNIEKYAKTNPLRDLYYGKVSLEHIKLIQKIEPELHKIKYFPPLLKDYEIKRRFFGS